MEIITSHTSADFDSLAAAVAAQKIYPDAKIVLPGTQDRNVREFLSLHEDIIDIVDPQSIDHKLVSRLVLVDTKIGRRLGDLKDIAYRDDVEIFTFDHHPSTHEDVPITRDYSEFVGATTTILVKIIRDKGLRITPFEATLFAIGIHEDTGSLTFKTTTYDDADAIAYLMANGANLEVIRKFLNPALTRTQHGLLDRLIHAARIERINSIPVMITRADVSEYIEGASVVVNKLVDLENMDVVFTLLGREDRVNVIARSRNDAVDVGDILENMGGGGHAQAASASVKDITVEKAEERLMHLLREHVKQPVLARRIMSSPVRVLNAATKISEANKLMIKYGHSGLPVIEDGKLVGLIGRREIDKAAHHGLSHAPVKGFMMRRIYPITPDTPLPDIQKLLIEENIGRVPVVENDEVVGIVTKTDVLKALGGDHYIDQTGKLKIAKPQYSRAEITQKMKALLPGGVQAILKTIGDVADQSGYNVYLVGGIVRDLLLNYQNLDVDIVVEGNAIEFAHLISSLLSGRVRAHEKFGTAVLILPDGFKIDFASARSEFYEKPAALPQVEPTSIRQDLARRDFTINAMAISLNKHDSGRLLDYFNGQRDLKNRRIRILHNLSFVEDPTRIFRGARFEQRLDFAMDSETEALLRKAVDMDLIGHLSNARVRDELMQILGESRPYKILKRLRDFGVLKIIDTNIKIDTSIKNMFISIEEAIQTLQYLLPGSGRKKTMYAAALLRRLKKPRLIAWCEGMKLRKADTARILELVLEAPKVVAELQNSKRMKNSRLYDLLHSLSAEAIVYVYALSLNETRESTGEAVEPSDKQIESVSMQAEYKHGIDRYETPKERGELEEPEKCVESPESQADALSNKEQLKAVLDGGLRARKRVMFYLMNLRGVKLSINGIDLRNMGYPPSSMYNVVLKELLAAKLNGRVETPEDEVKFVVERLSKQ